MTFANAALLFTMIWFLVFFVALAIPFRTQAEAGRIVPGTPASAPAGINLARRARFTTAIAAVLFACAWGVIELDLSHGSGLGDLPMSRTTAVGSNG